MLQHLFCWLQLQEALLQREADLLRLQEENNKLRRFLSTAFFRSLELKVRESQPPAGCAPNKHECTASDWGKLKRKQCCHQAPNPTLASRRVCSNLPIEFCHQVPGTSEPGLDVWVLQTLGLKDPDTIDTSSHTPSVKQAPLVGVATKSIQGGSSRSHDLSPPLSSPGEGRWSSHALCTQLMGDMTPLAPPTHCSSQESPVSAPAGSFPFYPTSSSTPLNDQQWAPLPWWHFRAGNAQPAFSTCLSPSSSVRTQSFPQGQVFLHRDPAGRWSFTWMPNRTPPHHQGPL